MPSAQETYHSMLRDQIAPALRTLGFKGSGRRFALPHDDYWALLGFQASTFSHADTVSFTVNLTVAPKREWEAARRKWDYLTEKPSGGSAYPLPESVIWHERISMLLPDHLDHWWDAHADSDTMQLAKDVADAIRDYALPAMRSRMT